MARRANVRVHDARGRAVVPSFVDAHTHAAFAEPLVSAPRVGKAGVHRPSLAGGTPFAPVAAVRSADERVLVADLRQRLDELLLLGTTSVEIESGLGLTLEAEVKQLRAVQAMGEVGPLTVIATFTGARTVPPKYAADPDAYVDLVRRIMLLPSSSGNSPGFSKSPAARAHSRSNRPTASWKRPGPAGSS